MNKPLRRFLLFLLLLAAFKQGKAQNADLIKHIQDLQATVENRRAAASIGKISANGKYLLPIGLLKANDGSKPAIIIDEINLYPTYAEVKAYAAFKLPGSDKPLYFGTLTPVKISYKGGVYGTARLNLLEDKEVNILGDDTKLIVKAGTVQNPGSYVEFDCKGFSGAKLSVEAELSKKLVPEINGVLDVNQRVKATFDLIFSDLNDIVAAATIQPFQVKGVPGVSFEINEATVDLSDLANSTSMVFPAGYTNDYYPGGLENLWRGFYLKSLKIKLPKELKDKSSNGARKEIQLNHMLIDNHGFSGEFIAKNVFNLTNGDMNGWSYSLDTIAISLKANQFVAGRLAGSLTLPIAEDKQLAYDAFLRPNASGEHLDFGFTIQTRSDLDFKIFKAGSVTLATGSSINVNSVDGEFKASANLSGSMAISASLTESENTSDANKFKIGTMIFQDLNISTTAPYLHSGLFSMPDALQAKVGKFGLSIDGVVLNIDENGKSKLGFTTKIRFGNEGDANNSFSGSTSLTILGNVTVNSSGKQAYTYQITQLDSVKLNINQTSFKLIGSLAFYREDPIYGSGFKGSLQVTMPMKLEMKANAMFGHLSGENGFQYWYVDASLTGVHLPIFPLIEINGFSGGLYYKVKQNSSSSGSSPFVQSGLNYTPNSTIGLGIKAGVMFGLVATKNPKLFNGEVGFEVVFNSIGGISRVSLMGNAYLIQQANGSSEKLTQLSNKNANYTKTPNNDAVDRNMMSTLKISDAALSSSVVIDYFAAHDEIKEHLKISTITTINVAGVLTGNIDGEAYFSASEWHIYLGTSLQRNTISLLDIASIDAYFMAGNIDKEYLNISVPANVTQAIGGRYKGISNLSSPLKNANGLAFGAGFQLNAGGNFLIFYGSVKGAAGFDVMLIDYGNATCGNSSTQIGAKGWYARGSAYAYISAEIGIRVRLFGKSRTYQIIKLSAGALLQAAVPNPNWVHGAVGGDYRILGGLIKGKCRFEFTLGKQCVVTGAPGVLETSLKIISEVVPGDKEDRVSPYATPKIMFDAPVNEIIYGRDDDVNGTEHKFKVNFYSFEIKKADGSLIPGEGVLNDSKTEYIFNPTNLLPPDIAITIKVEVRFSELVNGIWKNFKNPDGSEFVETVISNFKTTSNPLNLAKSNIKYTYPVENQANFYKEEYPNGYIILSKDQGYLFETNPNYIMEGVISTLSGKEIPLTMSYDTPTRTISYVMPSDSIPQNTISEVVIRLKPKTGGTIIFNDDMGELDEEGRIVIYRNSFRKSIYPSLGAKLAASSIQYENTVNNISKVIHLTNMHEGFSYNELFGDNKTNLIKLTYTIVSHSSSSYNENENENIYQLVKLDPELEIVSGLPSDTLRHDFDGPLYIQKKSNPSGNNQVNFIYNIGDYQKYYRRFFRFFYKYAGDDNINYIGVTSSIQEDLDMMTTRLPSSDDFPRGFPYFGSGDYNGDDYYLPFQKVYKPEIADQLVPFITSSFRYGLDLNTVKLKYSLPGLDSDNHTNSNDIYVQ